LLSQFARVVEIHRHAPALLDLLNFLESERRVQLRALQLHGRRGDLVRLAESAGLEGLLLLLHVPRYVEGVALPVAEAVDDGAAHAALLADRLPQRLRLAPVALEVLPLGDDEGLLAGGQHLLIQLLPPLRVVAAAVFVRGGNGARRTVLPRLCHSNQRCHQKHGQGEFPDHPATATQVAVRRYAFSNHEIVTELNFTRVFRRSGDLTAFVIPPLFLGD